jgi:hypothetical protein
LALKVKTVKEKIISHTNLFEPTVCIYNKALSFFMENKAKCRREAKPGRVESL